MRLMGRAMLLRQESPSMHLGERRERRWSLRSRRPARLFASERRRKLTRGQRSRSTKGTLQAMEMLRGRGLLPQLRMPKERLRVMRVVRAMAKPPHYRLRRRVRGRYWATDSVRTSCPGRVPRAEVKEGAAWSVILPVMVRSIV